MYFFAGLCILEFSIQQWSCLAAGGGRTSQVGFGDRIYKQWDWAWATG
jgi:hypothetical protein